MITIFLLLASTAFADKELPRGLPDKAFEGVPIDSWSEKGQSARLRWATRISHPMLGNHQRLAVRIRFQVDGVELLKRQGQGDLLFLTQIRDSGGALFQNHQSISLDHLEQGAGANYVVHSLDTFIVPGKYEVEQALFVPSTGEHAAVRHKLRVPGVAGDPLRDPWRNVPPVEFRPSKDPPEAWYLPSIKGRLNLRVETRRRVRIELLVNESPTEEVKGVRAGTFSRLNMGALIPAFKLLTQVDWANGSVDAAMLDLERRQICFEQRDIKDLEWPKLQEALNRVDPFRIDVASLQNREQDAQFFLSEVRRRVAEAENAREFHVFIILSGPMKFRKGEDLSPSEVVEHRNSRLFYVRYYSLIPESFPFRSPAPRSPGNSELLSVPAPPPLMSDSLVRLVQPLNPQLFDVTTPIEFRNALAKLLAGISKF